VFPDAGHTKLDLVRYYLSVAEGALRGVAGRPMILKRFVKGIGEEAVFQKRAPATRPEWLDVAELHYASGTSAAEIVVRDEAGLAWVINLGCVDLNPHPVLAEDLEHPAELRIDLDPVPGVEWQQIVDVALVAREVLTDAGLSAWPKTSGSRGFHIYAPVDPVWTYPQVRLAAEAVAREVGSARPGWRRAVGGRRNVTGCSSTSTRTPRTARWLRRTRCGPRRTRGCPRRCVGTRCAGSARRTIR